MSKLPFSEKDDSPSELHREQGEQDEQDEVGENRQLLAAARRFKILEGLADDGPKTIDEVLASLPERFKSFKRPVVEQDLREVFEIIGQRTLYRGTTGKNTTYELRAVDSLDQSMQSDSEGAQKQKIGDFVVDKFLVDAEVVYLSTGTTVRACARCMVQSIENGRASNVRIVLTDNLMVVELFLNETRQNDRLANIDFYVLGGKALWTHLDIGLEGNPAQLAQWGYSAAVVSATAVHPKTGNVYSYRQQETKLNLLRNFAVGTVVIPVTSSKVDNKKVAGKLILEPKAMRDDVRYVIVSNDLGNGGDLVKQLEGHGYQVFDVSAK